VIVPRVREGEFGRGRPRDVEVVNAVFFSLSPLLFLMRVPLSSSVNSPVSPYSSQTLTRHSFHDLTLEPLPRPRV